MILKKTGLTLQTFAPDGAVRLTLDGCTRIFYETTCHIDPETTVHLAFIEYMPVRKGMHGQKYRLCICDHEPVHLIGDVCIIPKDGEYRSVYRRFYSHSCGLVIDELKTQKSVCAERMTRMDGNLPVTPAQRAAYKTILISKDGYPWRVRVEDALFDDGITISAYMRFSGDEFCVNQFRFTYDRIRTIPRGWAPENTYYLRLAAEKWIAVLIDPDHYQIVNVIRIATPEYRGMPLRDHVLFADEICQIINYHYPVVIHNVSTGTVRRLTLYDYYVHTRSYGGEQEPLMLNTHVDAAYIVNDNEPLISAARNALIIINADEIWVNSMKYTPCAVQRSTRLLDEMHKNRGNLFSTMPMDIIRIIGGYVDPWVKAPVIVDLPYDMI